MDKKRLQKLCLLGFCVVLIQILELKQPQYIKLDAVFYFGFFLVFLQFLERTNWKLV